MTPSQFQILREDLRAINLRLDQFITRETFRDERDRVDAKAQELRRDIDVVSVALQDEAKARVLERETALNDQVKQAREVEKTRKAQTWQWVLLIAGAVISPITTFFVGASLPGGMGP